MREKINQLGESFLARIFTGTSAQGTATIVCPDEEPQQLLMELQRDIEYRYLNATDEERLCKAPSGIRHLTKILSEAQDDDDLDALKLYKEFSIFDNIGVNFALDDLRVALETDSLHGVVTQKHIDTHLRARLLFDEVTLSYTEADCHSEWSKLNVFIFRHNLDRADRILRIMDERQIIDPDEIEALMLAGESGSPSLSDGVL